MPRGTKSSLATAAAADPDRQGRHLEARPPAIKVYPGALHSFDLGGSPTLTSSGHMIGGNPEAGAASFAMTKAFLDARLKVK
jgi:dienelactone hydrolase